MGARLGQHFLRGVWAARALARAANIAPGNTVLEIGPGKGVLTRELLATGVRVIAVEKDETLVEKLQKVFPKEISSELLRIVACDVRDFEPQKFGLASGSYTIAANIPYYITGEILRQFLSAREKPRAMALLVQKEVAQRIVSKKESVLSLSVKAYGTPRVVAKVPRSNFSPPPKVDSAILLVEHISRDFFSDITEAAFFTAVHAGFSSKRKLLVNNLSEKLRLTKSKVLDTLTHCEIPEKARAENVSLEKWKCLCRSLRTTDSSRAS